MISCTMPSFRLMRRASRSASCFWRSSSVRSAATPVGTARQAVRRDAGAQPDAAGSATLGTDGLGCTAAPYSEHSCAAGELDGCERSHQLTAPPRPRHPRRPRPRRCEDRATPTGQPHYRFGSQRYHWSATRCRDAHRTWSPCRRRRRRREERRTAGSDRIASVRVRTISAGRTCCWPSCAFAAIPVTSSSCFQKSSADAN